MVALCLQGSRVRFIHTARQALSECVDVAQQRMESRVVAHLHSVSKACLHQLKAALRVYDEPRGVVPAAALDAQ